VVVFFLFGVRFWGLELLEGRIGMGWGGVGWGFWVGLCWMRGLVGFGEGGVGG